MRIGGFQKLTLLDFPGQVACIVFTAGCNFRCPFCHNSGLVENISRIEPVPEEEVFAYLRKRRGLLDGVVISGGEPLLQPDAESFIGRVRELGYLVKLDTNGSFPDRLERLLERGLLDYVAMDIKNSPARYGESIGMDASGFLPRISRSIELLRSHGVPFEFRTTLVRGINRPEETEALAAWIAGDEPYYLQSYEDSGMILNPEGLSSFSVRETEQMRDIAGKFCPKAELREK